MMCGLYSRLTIHHKMILEGFCLLTSGFVWCPCTLNLYCFSQANTIKVHRHGDKGPVASVFFFFFFSAILYTEAQARLQEQGCVHKDSVNHQQMKGNKWGDAWLSSVTVIIHTGEAKDAKHELTQSTSKSVKTDCWSWSRLCQHASAMCLHIHRFGVVLKWLSFAARFYRYEKFCDSCLTNK